MHSTVSDNFVKSHALLSDRICSKKCIIWQFFYVTLTEPKIVYVSNFIPLL